MSFRSTLSLRRRLRDGLTAFCLLTAALAAPAAFAEPPARAAAAPLPGDSVYQLPLPLLDQHGKRADWRARRGKPQLVAMFYTSCRYICPLIIDSAQAVDRNLGAKQRERLGILLVSMDPERDDAAALGAVARQRRLDARWTLAAPRPQDVRAVAGILGIRYRPLADGEFNHTSALVLLDADGRILARTERMGTRPDPEFVEVVRKATAP